MNLKNIKLSQKFIMLVILMALSLLGLLGYWLISSLQSRSQSASDIMANPTLIPPQLTPEELARIQNSINAPAGNQVLTDGQLKKALNSLTAPKK